MVRYPELDGRVVLVTGAGRGIGKGIAAAFGRQASVVIVNDIDAETAQATVDEIVAEMEKHLIPGGMLIPAAVGELVFLQDKGYRLVVNH